ncbi:MAG: hypothetical protein ILP10_05745 [Lachnospiraceae bacterium]|nr:hypothetical protein [Lachnospiraceae bacterium]
MEYEGGEWIIKGLGMRDPKRVRGWREAVKLVEEVGFLPLFSNGIEGFSLEEHAASRYWFSGNRDEDPWEWREIIAADRQVAYGKFFDNKAGFISREWLPVFANCRRLGYDFDARWQDGLATRREKLIMDFYMGEDEEGEVVWKNDEILSTDLKKLAGFGKNGEKNYPGVITSLQMNLYLVITGFRKRKNKKGQEYGMPVSIMFPPEAVWGREAVACCYEESPEASWKKICDRVRELYPGAGEDEVTGLIGRCPAK